MTSQDEVEQQPMQQQQQEQPAQEQLSCCGRIFYTPSGLRKHKMKGCKANLEMLEQRRQEKAARAEASLARRKEQKAAHEAKYKDAGKRQQAWRNYETFGREDTEERRQY